MEETKQIKQELIEAYPLIPMSEITDEARRIAVLWMEYEDKRWIGNKHKLASDIMNYAKNYATALLSEPAIVEEIVKELLSDDKINLHLKEYCMTKLNTDEEISRFKMSLLKFTNYYKSKLLNR